MRTRLAFTERMTGHFAVGAADFQSGREEGERTDSSVTFVVTVDISDLDALMADSTTVAAITGSVDIPALSDEPLAVRQGTFQMMVPDPSRVSGHRMLYVLDLESADGGRYQLNGFKTLKPDRLTRLWRATTTLYVTLFETPTAGESREVGRGVMIIEPRDLLAQGRSFEVEGPKSALGRLRCKLRFANGFMGRVTPLYAGEFDTKKRFEADHTGTLRDLRLPTPERLWRSSDRRWHDGTIGDDASAMLTRYRGGEKGPLLLAAGYGMAASSFATPTTDTTLAEYASEAGYDVWLFDYRASIDLPSVDDGFTIDDIALIDWPDAVAEVRRVSGADSVQVLGHCVGAVSILMAQLGGLEGVGTIVCSQFTLHPSVGRLNRIKNALRVGDLLHLLKIKGVEPRTMPTFANKALDMVLLLVPYPRGEKCQRPICRWLNAIYGLTHTHDQLNDSTHETFDEAFGFGGLPGIRHLALMARKGRAVDHTGADTYLPHVERLAVPVLFVQGTRNHIFRPAGTSRTIEWLSNTNDAALYERLDLADYAHLDAMVGRTADIDVFPPIFDFLDRHQEAR